MAIATDRFYRCLRLRAEAIANNAPNPAANPTPDAVPLAPGAAEHAATSPVFGGGTHRPT